jgi:ABC-type multidrug transport system ATPase subunit
MRDLHLEVHSNKPVEVLSGGTARKLSLAVALLNAPEVLLLGM